MKPYKEEITRGQKKLKQLCDDLWRNKHFVDRLNKILPALNSKLSELFEEFFSANPEDDNFWMYGMGGELLPFIEDALMQLNTSKRKEYMLLAKWLAENYAIDHTTLSFLIAGQFLRTNPYFSLKHRQLAGYLVWHEAPDICQIDARRPSKQNLSSTEREIKDMDWECFPVVIKINRDATWRDVLQFIKERRAIITGCLDSHGRKHRRIRQRKLHRGLMDLIWDNRDKPRNEIKKIVETKFPSYKINYEDVAKLISIEKERRTKKLP